MWAQIRTASSEFGTYRLCIRAVSPEPSLLTYTSSESRGTFRQKARSLAPLNGWACAVKICHDGMLEDTNSLDGAHIISLLLYCWYCLPTAMIPMIVRRLWGESISTSHSGKKILTANICIVYFVTHKNSCALLFIFAICTFIIFATLYMEDQQCCSICLTSIIIYIIIPWSILLDLFRKKIVSHSLLFDADFVKNNHRVLGKRLYESLLISLLMRAETKNCHESNAMFSANVSAILQFVLDKKG